MAEMNHYRAVALAEGFEDGTEDEVLAAWQYIWDHGLWRSMQGWFGRQVYSMVMEGLISADRLGEVA
jgi:hypothetical protein